MASEVALDEIRSRYAVAAPDPRRHTLTSITPEALPSWLGDIRLSGVHAYDRLWDIHLEDGRTKVEEL